MSDKIELSDNPIDALHEIASYLRSVNMTERRQVRECDGEVAGYYQLTEWLAGLLEIAGECDRIVSLSNTQNPPMS